MKPYPEGFNYQNIVQRFQDLQDERVDKEKVRHSILQHEYMAKTREAFFKSVQKCLVEGIHTPIVHLSSCITGENKAILLQELLDIGFPSVRCISYLRLQSNRYLSYAQIFHGKEISTQNCTVPSFDECSKYYFYSVNI